MLNKSAISFVIFLALLYAGLAFSGEMLKSFYEKDFGKVSGDVEISHIFEIENKGEGSLFIESVESG